MDKAACGEESGRNGVSGDGGPASRLATLGVANADALYPTESAVIHC